MFNEVMVSTYLYILMILNISLGSRELAGMFLVSVIMVTFIANLFNFMYSATKEIIFRLKKYRINRKDRVVAI